MPTVNQKELAAQIRILDYLRIYMSASTMKNPLVMIDDFIRHLELGNFEGRY